MTSLNDSISLLKKAGINNPYHVTEIIEEVIDFLKLDLSGLIVLTEAASGPYVVTPVIASMANADKVIALTADSDYARADEVIHQTRALQTISGCKKEIEIHTLRTKDLFSRADIITNLGFVRPIDADAVSVMKPTAVIPLMCEGWEIRPEDIDFIFCRSKGIPVVGTNEEYPGLDTLSYCGWLCIRMMMEAQVELPQSRILIVSEDKFGPVIEEQLKNAHLAVTLIGTLNGIDNDTLSHFDTLIIADYTTDRMIIGDDADISPAVLAAMRPSISVIQFAGKNDIDGLLRHNINVYPEKKLQPHRMALTLAGLGPRPVIELHAAGLRVGELLARARKHRNLSADDAIQYAIKYGPGDPIKKMGVY